MKTFVLGAMTVMFALTTAARAGITTIWSDGFENYSGDTYLPDWIGQWGNLVASGSSSQVFQPLDTDFSVVSPLAPPAGGTHALWIGGDGGWAARYGQVIAANTVYTLTAAVGERLCDIEGLWELQLWAGNASGPGTLLTETAYNSPGANLPSVGGWAENSVTFDSTGSSYVGEVLWAELATDAVGGYDNGMFNNVQLDANSPVPEPSTLIVWSLLGALAVSLGWRRRRKAG